MYRVSSNIDKFSHKNNLIDDNSDTCWSSSQGSPQWIDIKFTESQNLSKFNLTFQGGFVGKICKVLLFDDNQSEVYQQSFYPIDVNRLQSFKLNEIVSCSSVKFLFQNSTDFYGRVTVYNLDLFNE